MSSNEKNVLSNLGLVLRRSVMDASEMLTDSEFRELIKILYHYAVTGEVNETKSETCRIIFNMERSFLDFNREKFISRAKNKNQDL